MARTVEPAVIQAVKESTRGKQPDERSREEFARAMRNTRRMAVAGVPIGVGSDGGSSIDSLLETTDDEEVIVRSHHDKISGMSVWPLTRNRDPNGTQVVKMRIVARRKPSFQVHPGRDWFFVLSGTARLLLGDREIFVETGQAAEFATMTPHWIGAHGGPVELLSIFDLNGEKAHLRAAPTAAKSRRTALG